MLNILHEAFCIYHNKLRTYYWGSIFNRFGRYSRVLGRIVVYSPKKIKVGEHTSINEGVLINARAPITIGNHVHISPFCIINAGGLDYEKTMAERNHVALPITIEDGVWIGSGAIINPGVIIGKNAVIAAGAVVTKNIAPNSVAVGVPAREVKSIDGKEFSKSDKEEKRSRQD